MKLLFLFLSIILCTACSGKEVFSTTWNTSNPLEELTWLNQIKTSFEQSGTSVKREIYQYNYQGSTVFLVDDCARNCSDALQIVYNCREQEICEFGGIAGVNTCPNFYEKATNKIILYEN